jgi:hypothetical protein
VFQILEWWQFVYLHVNVKLASKGKGKGKGKVYPRTGHEGPEGEWRYSSTLSLTSALDGGGWSTPRPKLASLKQKCLTEKLRTGKECSKLFKMKYVSCEYQNRRFGREAGSGESGLAEGLQCLSITLPLARPALWIRFRHWDWLPSSTNRAPAHSQKGPVQVIWQPSKWSGKTFYRKNKKPTRTFCLTSQFL